MDLRDQPQDVHETLEVCARLFRPSSLFQLLRFLHDRQRKNQRRYHYEAKQDTHDQDGVELVLVHGSNDLLLCLRTESDPVGSRQPQAGLLAAVLTIDGHTRSRIVHFRWTSTILLGCRCTGGRALITAVTGGGNRLILIPCTRSRIK